MLELSLIITNGYVSADTMAAMQEDGFTFVVTVPANLAHPHSPPTDKLSIFAKYSPPNLDGVATAKQPEHTI